MKDYPNGFMTRKQFLKVYQDYYKKGDPSGFSEHVFRVFDANNDGKIGKRNFYVLICFLTIYRIRIPTRELVLM